MPAYKVAVLPNTGTCWAESQQRCKEIGPSLVRRKYFDKESLTKSKLARVLGTLDLTALGIGSTLGAGIYVVAGQVARSTAGPSVILSFFIAALASVLSGLCYAEFGARVPRTGSAYVYSYVTVGELWAFIIGWNLVLEYVIGAASVARAWSAYFDSLVHNTIEEYLLSHLPMDVPGLSPYPDFFALAIILLLTAILCIGVRESSAVNNIFTAVNLLVVLFIVVSGLFQADVDNWKIPADQVPNATVYEGVVHENGEGGFFPFGFSGMVSGAATCFYAFIGFDVIATTGEEARNPQRAIPISICLALLFCFLAYFGISAVLTLMAPYYELSGNAPLPFVFDKVGWTVAKYVISVGAVCGLSTSLLGSMFPMPRVIYSMANDGLLFKFLASINPRFKTPIIATISSGLLAGLMTTFFDLKELVDMMSIGTLLAYTLVSCCVLILRYRSEAVGRRDAQGLPTQQSQIPLKAEESNSNFEKMTLEATDDPGMNYLPRSSTKTSRIYTKRQIVRAFFKPMSAEATILSSDIVMWAVFVLCILILVLSITLNVAMTSILNKHLGSIAILTVFILMTVVTCVIIWRQPQSEEKCAFMVPLVPLLPVISVFINLYLMTQLSTGTWIRFAVWMAAGFAIYFFYGIWHSTERVKYPEQYQEQYAPVTDEPDFTVPPNESAGEGILKTEESTGDVVGVNLLRDESSLSNDQINGVTGKELYEIDTEMDF